MRPSALLFAAGITVVIVVSALVVFLSPGRQPPGREPAEPLLRREPPADGPGSRTSPLLEPDGSPDVSAPRAQPADTELSAILADLRQALERGDADAVRRLAGDLRAAVRREPAALDAAGEVLLDPAAGEPLRGTVALVLGTLDGPPAESYLLRVLQEGPSDELTTWLLLALGAWKGQPDLDNRFSFEEGGPWVVESPGGLRLPIRARIERPEVLGLLIDHLLTDNPLEHRRASVQVLRHSLAAREVWEAFLDVLDGEEAPPIQAEAAAALGEWTLAEGHSSSESRRVRRKLFDLAAEPEQSLLRLKIEPVLKSGPLARAEAEALLGLVSPGTAGDFRVCYFGMELAAAHLPQLLQDAETSPAGERILDSLKETLGTGTDPKLREKAAESLGAITHGDTVEALAASLRGDSAWHVRLAAARALRAASPGSEGAAQALQRAAGSDPDPRVRAAARGALTGR